MKPLLDVNSRVDTLPARVRPRADKDSVDPVLELFVVSILDTSDGGAGVEKVLSGVAAVRKLEAVLHPDGGVTREDTLGLDAALGVVTEGVGAAGGKVVDSGPLDPTYVVDDGVVDGLEGEGLDVGPAEGDELVVDVEVDVLLGVVELPAASVEGDGVVVELVIDPVDPGHELLEVGHPLGLHVGGLTLAPPLPLVEGSEGAGSSAGDDLSSVSGVVSEVLLDGLEVE